MAANLLFPMDFVNGLLVSPGSTGGVRLRTARRKLELAMFKIAMFKIDVQHLKRGKSKYASLGNRRFVHQRRSLFSPSSVCAGDRSGLFGNWEEEEGQKNIKAMILVML
jgi:hypothetical protein